jgi:hypothetical protein
MNLCIKPERLSDLAGKACQGQTLEPINSVNCGQKSFITLGPGVIVA